MAAAHRTGTCSAGVAARQAGVSLLEMLLVVALVAAASLLAMAAFSGGLAGIELRSVAREIAAQLRHTRVRAIASGEPQRFLIDPAARTWQGPDGRHGEIPQSLQVRFSGARQAQERAGEGAVLFFPDGAATGGRVTLARGGAAWDIDIAWLTGEVRLTRAAAAAP